MLPQSVSSRAVESGAKYGAIAGLIATWSISTAIAASELELGLPIGTFYAVIGTSLGYGDFAAYGGFGLHLLTGSALGAAFGFIAARFTIRILFSPYRSVLMGMATGMAVWLVLFLPVTMLLVQPLLARPGQFLDGNLLGAGQSIWGIALSAIAFHIAWGAIFGYVVSALMRIRAFKIVHKKEGAEK